MTTFRCYQLPSEATISMYPLVSITNEQPREREQRHPASVWRPVSVDEGGHITKQRADQMIKGTARRWLAVVGSPSPVPPRLGYQILEPWMLS